MKNIINILGIFGLMMCLCIHVEAQECGWVAPEDDSHYRKLIQAQSDAVNRQKSMNTTYYIPVQIHRILDSNAGSSLSGSDIGNIMGTINQLYSDANMFFYQCNPIKDILGGKDEYCKNDQDFKDMLTNNKVSKVINIFFAPDLICHPPRCPSKRTCGYGTEPWQAQGREEVVINNACAENGSTPAHELGHYFSLYHTYQPNKGLEAVTRDSNDTCYNCEDTADFLCGTPADPELRCKVNSSNEDQVGNVNPADVNPDGCGYDDVVMNRSEGCYGEYSIVANATATDHCGSEYDPPPPTRNIMSFSCKECRDTFVPEQIGVMRNSYLNNRKHLHDTIATDNYGSGQDIDVAANYTITASNKIYSGAEVDYDAGKCITLTAGFDAYHGSTFHAFIDPCDESMLIVDGSGSSSTDYSNEESALDKSSSDTDLSLHNYPNPFTGQTTIEYNLPDDSPVTLIVTDITGKQISVLVNNEVKTKGQHTAVFNGANYSAGMYYYTIRAGEYYGTQKMILAK